MKQGKVKSIQALNFFNKKVQLLLCCILLMTFSCTKDKPEPTPDDEVENVDTDGDGIFDASEIENGTDKNDACSPAQNENYTGYDKDNAIWKASDCDNDGVTNGNEIIANTNPYKNILDTDGDGILDTVEIANGTNENDACSPKQEDNYTGYNASNAIWKAADCDTDGVPNETELTNGTNPYKDDIDTDGDGVLDTVEVANNSDKNNPCDPQQASTYLAYDAENELWKVADCDGDGVNNTTELTNGTNPYKDDIDTDGDGILDTLEVTNNTDKNNPCDPAQAESYIGYDKDNTIWAAADCDADGVTNANEVKNGTNPYKDERVFAVSEFLTNLSELKVFTGTLNQLKLNSTAIEYDLQTPLFTDYSYKLRTISLPKDTKITYENDGLLVFPDNTVITKTFYYLKDESNASLGTTIIETRVLIKKNGTWQMGGYHWNDAQTEAVLYTGYFNEVKVVEYKNKQGENKNVNYEIPSQNLCIACHNTSSVSKPIGTKARNLNFEFKGENQLQNLINLGLLEGAPQPSTITAVPNWEDETATLESRARAYMDINCAHCHMPGGNVYAQTLNLQYQTSYLDTGIEINKQDVIDRLNTNEDNRMPFLGTTIKHTEGIQLIEDYINSLD